MNEPRLWEKLRKCELHIQRVTLDLAAIGAELRMAEESQLSQPECEICKALDEQMKCGIDRK